MKKKLFLGIALVSLGLSTAAVAGPSEGDWEVVFSQAGGSLATNSDATTLGAGISAGKFISGSTHEVGFLAGFAYTDTNAGSGEALNLGGFYRYNMATSDSTEWLYGGVELELVDVTNSDTSMETIRPHFGKKWMLSDDVVFDVNGGVVVPTDSDLDASFDVRFGLGIFF